MALLERCADLRIAALAPGEEPPPGVQWARVPAPPEAEIRARLADGWFLVPARVTYVLDTPVSLEAHLDAFRPGARRKHRRLLREVPARFRFEVDRDGRRLGAFRALYRRTLLSRPLGCDHLPPDERLRAGWTGLHLFDGEDLVAGVLVKSRPERCSVAYGAFDPVRRRGLDLEHYLILRAIERAGASGRPRVSRGMDTNRYGHHLSLGLVPYKLRLGFRPLPWEPSGRELVKPLDLVPFVPGLFFYSYGDAGELRGELFGGEEVDLRAWGHPGCPPMRRHPGAQVPNRLGASLA
jgi:hypothetical protein